MAALITYRQQLDHANIYIIFHLMTFLVVKTLFFENQSSWIGRFHEHLGLYYVSIWCTFVDKWWKKRHNHGAVSFVRRERRFVDSLFYHKQRSLAEKLLEAVHYHLLALLLSHIAELVFDTALATSESSDNLGDIRQVHILDIALLKET